MNLTAFALPCVFPRLVPFERGVNQFYVKPGVGLPKPLHRLPQFEKPARCRLFKQANRSNHGKSTGNGGSASCAVIHQDSGGFDLLREANGFQLACVHVQHQVDCLGRLHGSPVRQRVRPFSYGRWSIRLLKFAEDRWRNYNLAEETRQGCFRSTENEVMQR